MGDLLTTTSGLWLAVVLSGLYHGLNPGMGWPLAVSAALMDGRQKSLYTALAALAAGHFLAMLVVLLPFSVMSALVTWERPLRIGAGMLVIALGLWLLITRKHPRFLARVPPSRLMLWSFLVAIVHGAALMLVPIYLGLNRMDTMQIGQQAAFTLMESNLTLTLAVATLHTAAMLSAGGGLAFVVHRWLGLRFLSQGWFDLEALWALSLILVGAIGVYSAL